MKAVDTLLGLLALLVFTSAQSSDCPPLCTCYYSSDEIVVTSSFALTTIPSSLPVGTTKLNFSFNFITELRERDFRNLTSLKYLLLDSNRIKNIQHNAFQHLTLLQELDLSNNSIETLPEDLFQTLRNLKTLKLRHNKIGQISDNVFDGLVSLEYLSLNNNSIPYQHGQRTIFKNIKNLRYFSSDNFYLKCLARRTSPLLPQVKIGMFANCDSLLRDHQYRVLVWIFGLSALVGNAWVIVYWLWVARKQRGRRAEKARVQSFLVTNLAVSDLFMGIYLLIIALLDTEWEGSFFEYDATWRASHACKMTGILCMISSEASVLILVTITADRLNCIVYHIKAKKFSMSKARVACVIIWFITLLISVIPILPIDYFYNKDRGISLYGVTPVCLPLQLSQLSFGWEYVFAVYIVFNGVAFLFILIAYIVIFYKVKVSSQMSHSSIKRETLLARRVIWIVMTDFCCWFPVIVMGCLTLSNKSLLVENASWLALVVLPINSSINPVLYTFSNQMFRDFCFDVFTCRRLLLGKSLVSKDGKHRASDGKKVTSESADAQPAPMQQYPDHNDNSSITDKQLTSENNIDKSNKWTIPTNKIACQQTMETCIDGSQRSDSQKQLNS